MFSQDNDPQVASEKFGQRIKELRVERGLSKDRLAREADMHPTAVKRIECGERDPRLTTIRRIAHGLGIEPGVLLDGWSPLLAPGERRLTPEEFEKHFGHLPTDGDG
jgi:transcriptional regulator with XRE-family HTH domain